MKAAPDNKLTFALLVASVLLVSGCIMGVFHIGWIYDGLLIASRPVIAWNMIAVVINYLSAAAYLRFARRERH